jgi:Xaa-Pro dipeptidase
MDADIFQARINKAREKMAENEVDVFFINPSSNMFYFTGYGIGQDERLLLLILPNVGEPFIIANLIYQEQIAPLPVKDKIFWKDGDDPFVLLISEIEKRNIKTKSIALESHLPAMFSIPLINLFPNAGVTLGSVITDPLRQYKDENELELIRYACRESDQALTAVIDRICCVNQSCNAGNGADWQGKTEKDFLFELGNEFSSRDLSSFGASVQVGANAAVPHYSTGKTIIEKGKCMLVDFWARYKGYYTDCTRTFFFGKPEKEFEKIYAVVLEANLMAEAKAQAGNTLHDVDTAARTIIEKYGYGEYFTHRTGHGLGIDIHEGDSVNANVKVLIKPGMVFSIEPGIYLPGRFGVRIENLVAIGENGTEVLHKFPRELRIMGI